jgi:cyclohexyl-isocyanide hydratase
MIPESVHLNIGSLLFENLDQIDLTGPFEVLSRLPNATHRIYAKSIAPVRDVMGLRIMPDATLGEAPQLDILHVPGGPGQQALMEDEEVLGWLRSQAEGAKKVLSVCIGALLFGGAGLIRGKRATTYWASFHLLPYFGAIPVDERVVVDGDWTFAAGATSGIDGALQLAAEVRGVPTAQLIQLEIAYAPEPPFQSGTPHTAPPEIAERASRNSAKLIARREATARQAAASLGSLSPMKGLKSPGRVAATKVSSSTGARTGAWRTRRPRGASASILPEFPLA